MICVRCFESVNHLKMICATCNLIFEVEYYLQNICCLSTILQYENVRVTQPCQVSFFVLSDVLMLLMTRGWKEKRNCSFFDKNRRHLPSSFRSSCQNSEPRYVAFDHSVFCKKKRYLPCNGLCSACSPPMYRRPFLCLCPVELVAVWSEESKEMGIRVSFAQIS